MQSVSSRIWTRIVVSNSYDDNHYTTVYIWTVLQKCMFRGTFINLDKNYGDLSLEEFFLVF